MISSQRIFGIGNDAGLSIKFAAPYCISRFYFLDTPYVNEKGIGVDYADFYHFLDGLVNYKYQFVWGFGIK